MTSEPTYPDRIYVWTWLPGRTTPVVAGALTQDGDAMPFLYGRSYLARPDAISLGPELPLQAGPISPDKPLTVAGCLRDGSPDAWGRRVIEARLNADGNTLPERGYMLESGSNRFGANDFQTSPTAYQPRQDTATLDELHEAAGHLLDGDELSPALAAALVHGTPIGGARPKVLLTDAGGVEWIAKLSAPYDVAVPTIQAEAAAYHLARRAGIDVPETQLVRSLGRHVLLVRRFDRGPHRTRRHTLSALTLAREDESAARYVSYPTIVHHLIHTGQQAESDARELFARIVLNIAISNSDDHARNHAFFWDGTTVTLTPAYDLAPGPRSGHTATQAMAIDNDGNRDSTFATCLRAAPVYGLDAAHARDIIDGTIEAIRAGWDAAADHAQLTAEQRQRMWGRQILNPGTGYGYPGPTRSTGRARPGPVRKG